MFFEDKYTHKPASQCVVSGDDYQRHWGKPEAVIVEFPDHPGWTPTEMIGIFFNLLFMELLEGTRSEMTPEMAGRWATRLAHYGRIELADREVKEQGWSVVQRLTGMEE